MPALTDHPSFLQPLDENIKIWRYMDFTKYVSLISSNSLFFNRSDMFDDPFEGSFPKQNHKLRIAWHKEHSSSNTQEATDRAILDRQKFKEQRKEVYLNCWHANNFESAAMWKLYSKTNESITIESTYFDLKNTLPDNIYLGLVKYIDYSGTEFIPEHFTISQYMYKRKSFEHENEVRALLDERIEKEYGINIEVDLNQLIKKIYIAPDAPDWMLELTKKVSKEYNIKAEIQKSNLNEEPVF